MSPAQVKNLEARVNRLEKLVEVVLHQDDRDWLNNPELVKKLDIIANDDTSIAEKDADLH